MGRVIRKLIFLSMLIITILATTRVTHDIVVEVDDDNYIVDKFTPTYSYFEYDNVGVTTINGLSNIYYNMKKDGYEVYKEDDTPMSIDVSFVKDNSPSYRFYYEKTTGNITIFCSNYEESVNGQSYIREDKEWRI